MCIRLWFLLLFLIRIIMLPTTKPKSHSFHGGSQLGRIYSYLERQYCTGQTLTGSFSIGYKGATSTTVRSTLDQKNKVNDTNKTCYGNDLSHFVARNGTNVMAKVMEPSLLLYFVLHSSRAIAIQFRTSNARQTSCPEVEPGLIKNHPKDQIPKSAHWHNLGCIKCG